MARTPEVGTCLPLKTLRLFFRQMKMPVPALTTATFRTSRACSPRSVDGSVRNTGFDDRDALVPSSLVRIPQRSVRSSLRSDHGTNATHGTYETYVRRKEAGLRDFRRTLRHQSSETAPFGLLQRRDALRHLDWGLGYSRPS